MVVECDYMYCLELGGVSGGGGVGLGVAFRSGVCVGRMVVGKRMIV